MNQLISVNQGGVKASYAYNAAGLRIQKKVGASLTKQVWDGQEMVAELTGAGNTQITTYARGHNLIFSNNNLNQKTFYQYNGHGDVDRLTNVSGAVVKAYTYDLFGSEKNPDPNDTNPFRYSGEYLDKETGSYYLRARFYNPSYGRFITEDSYEGQIDNPLSLNLYTYTYNNPIKYVDPSGHDAIVVTAKDAANGAGHTSALFQDKNGDWFYTYWGDKGVLAEKVNATSVKELNKWINSKEFAKWSTIGYTSSTYIVGDFTDSLVYFETKIKDFNGEMGTKNEDYGLFLYNCLDVTIEALKMGKSKEGASMENLFHEGMVPNIAESKFYSTFHNNAFTIDGYKDQIAIYEAKLLELKKRFFKDYEISKSFKWY